MIKSLSILVIVSYMYTCLTWVWFPLTTIVFTNNIIDCSCTDQTVKTFFDILRYNQFHVKLSKSQF